MSFILNKKELRKISTLLNTLNKKYQDYRICLECILQLTICFKV